MPDIARPTQLDTDAEFVERIVDIWRSVLDRPDVTADSHLLDLGANSLTAVKIRSRIRSDLGREIDLVELLDHPTPRELAPVVSAAPEWAGFQPWDELDWSAGDGGAPG
jgi:acyl carrier protein